MAEGDPVLGLALRLGLSLLTVRKRRKVKKIFVYVKIISFWEYII